MEQRQRIRLTSALILALVFGTGIVLGMAVDRTAAADPPAEVGETAQEASDAEEGEAEASRERRTPMYEQVGELTPEQAARIDELVDAYRTESREMRRAWEEEFEPVRRAREAWEAEHVEPLRERWEQRFDSLTRVTRAEIRGVMSPEQAERYDSLLAEYEKRRAEARRQDHDSGGDRRD